MDLKLANPLEEVYRAFHRPEFLRLDPLEWVHAYSHPVDQQIAGILVAVMAHGAVEQIRRFSSDLLNRVQQETGDLRNVLEAKPEALSRALKGFYYRFNQDSDFVNLLLALGRAVHRHGSLHDWIQGAALRVSTAEREEWGVLGATLSRLQRDLSDRGEIPFLWSDPLKGSACKRLCMLFRWMVRRDALDFGHWSGDALSAKDLIIPLDVHLWRWAREVGWTNRSTPSWKAAREITARFAQVDPEDPIRFDFALCRSGMIAVRPGRA